MFKNFSSLPKSSFKSPFASFKTTSNYSPFFNVTYNVVHTVPTLHNGFFLASFATKKEPKKVKNSLAEESVSQVTRIVKKAKEKSAKKNEPEKKETQKRNQDVTEKEKAKIQKEKAKEKQKKEKILAKKKEQKAKLAKLKEKEKLAAAQEKAQKVKEKQEQLAAKIKRKQERVEKRLAAFQYKAAIKEEKKKALELASQKKVLQKAALKEAALKQKALAKPTRRANSFLFFAKSEIPKVYAEFKESHPKLTPEIRKKMFQLAAQRWAALSPEESQVFKQQSRLDGERAAREWAQYKQSVGPKRPASAFVLFLSNYRGTLRASNPNMSPQECAIRGGEAWRALTEEEKKEWFQKSSERREQWFKAKAERKNASVQGTQ